MYVSLAYTASLMLQAQDHVTQAYLYVWNQPCSQALTQLSVGTTIDGRLRLGIQLVYTVYTSHHFTNKTTSYTNADADKLYVTPLPNHQALE